MTAPTRLQLGFVEPEDRLLLRIESADGVAARLLTRRLTRRLITAFARLLVESSAVARRAPLGMRTEVILFEHQSALQPAAAGGEQGDGGPAAPATPQGPGAAGMPTVLQAVHVDTHPHHFAVTLDDGRERLTLELGRLDLHRLLSTLHRLARLAEWGLDLEGAWLAAAEGPPDAVPSNPC